ncbi:MAG: pilus assembly protein PilM [Vicinamibacterales bacterium]
MALWSPFRSVTCGFDLGSHSIHVAAVAHTRGHRTLLAAESLPAGAEAPDRLLALFARWRLGRFPVIAAMPTQSAFVRRVTMGVREEEVGAALPGLAGRLLPFPPADLHLDHQLLTTATGSTGEALDVLLVAARRDHVRERLAALSVMGALPALLDIEVLALVNAYLTNYPDRRAESVVLVDVGHGSTTMACVEQGRPTLTRVIDVGGRRYLEALTRDAGVAPDEAAAILRTPDAAALPSLAADVLRDLHQQLAQELRRSCATRVEAGASPSRLVLSGGACRVPGLREALMADLGYPADHAEPCRRVPARHAPAVADAPAFMIAVGLALRHPADRGARQ